MDTVPVSKVVDMLESIELVGTLGLDLYVRKGGVIVGTELESTYTLTVPERYVSLRDYWTTRLQKAS